MKRRLGIKSEALADYLLTLTIIFYLNSLIYEKMSIFAQINN